MKKDKYKCPEIENLKKLTEDFFKETKKFIEIYKSEKEE